MPSLVTQYVSNPSDGTGKLMTTSTERVTDVLTKITPMVKHFTIGRRGAQEGTYRNLAVWRVGVGPGAWFASMDEEHRVTEDEISEAIASFRQRWPQPPHIEGSQPTAHGAKRSLDTIGHYIGPMKGAA